MKKTVNLCWLWNDAMNRNGSQGNVLSLRRRLEWRGMNCRVKTVSVGEKLDLSDCDILYLGAGLPYDNEELLAALEENAQEIRNYVNSGKTLLAICEGFELLGKSITLADGRRLKGAAVGPYSTVYGEKRVAGNLIFEYQKSSVVCFENHASQILLEEGADPLGKVTYGQGNNTKDDSFGLRYRNFFGAPAYALLPNNPALADAILLAVLRKENPKAQLDSLNDSFETLSHDLLCARLKQGGKE